MLRKLQILGAIMGVLLAAFLIVLARRPVSPVDRTNPLASALAQIQCDFVKDAGGVYHIRPTATSPRLQGELTTFVCFGYAHGRVRSWQMDYLRRLVQGRRSEISNYHDLKADFGMRMLGLYESAGKIFSKMTPDEQSTLWAYTLGVNHAFDEVRETPGYEFKKMGYLPEPWHPIDSIALILLQGFSQTRKSFDQDLDEEEWKKTYGAVAEGLYSPEGVPWDTSVLKRGEYPLAGPQVPRDTIPMNPPGARWTPKKQVHEKQTVTANWREYFDLGTIGDQLETGSNNWVIAPALSKTKHAWFANDPHLDIRHPPFWEWIHLQSTAPDLKSEAKIDAFGASLPGVPSIASGTNRNVSWGLTNAYIDVADIYAVPTEELKDVPKVRPLIWVRVWKFWIPFVFKTYQRVSFNGTEKGQASSVLPVLPIPAPEGKSFLLRWSGYDVTPQDVLHLKDIMSAKSADEVDLTLSQIGVPSWNFVFADTQGKVGHRVIGKAPKRLTAPFFGTLKTSLKDIPIWEYLSAAEMPHVLGPARGYVATANNHHWPSDSLFKDGRAQAKSFRAYRIEELIHRSSRHDLESLREIQCDIQATDAKFISPLLIAAAKKKSFQAQIQKVTIDSVRVKQMLEAIQLLKEWDFSTGPTCRACGIFRRWVSLIKDETLLNDISLYRVLKTGMAPQRSAIPPAVALSFEEVYARSLKQTVEDLLKGHNGAFPTWKELHLQGFIHLAAPTFFDDPKRIFAPGDFHTISMGESTWEDHHFEMHTGPSQRLLIEMTSPPVIYGVLGGSNDDLEFKEIDQPGGPWIKWASCQYDRIEFPYDWERRKESIQKISF